ncbi:MAG: heavy-metal-associated domain-containing protein [Anaerolineae bacterium]|mgnify:FL=1|jgi:copper chaperone CopZ
MAERVTWVAPDISCGHCAMRIRKALAEVAGVSDVSVDVESKTVRFSADDDSVKGRARQALVDAGYPPKTD